MVPYLFVFARFLEFLLGNLQRFRSEVGEETGAGQRLRGLQADPPEASRVGEAQLFVTILQRLGVETEADSEEIVRSARDAR